MHMTVIFKFLDIWLQQGIVTSNIYFLLSNISKFMKLFYENVGKYLCLKSYVIHTVGTLDL